MAKAAIVFGSALSDLDNSGSDEFDSDRALAEFARPEYRRIAFDSRLAVGLAHICRHLAVAVCKRIDQVESDL